MRKIFLELFLKSFNNSKAPAPAHDEMEHFIKSILDIVEFLADEYIENRNLSLLILGKFMLALGIYLQSTENYKALFTNMI
jgi:hypothetical protein